jgi:hypothetical protein
MLPEKGRFPGISSGVHVGVGQSHTGHPISVGNSIWELPQLITVAPSPIANTINTKVAIRGVTALLCLKTFILVYVGGKGI